MSRIRSSFVVLLAVAGLVLALDYATFAATGGSLILGRANSADRPTVVTNTGTGPAVSLRARSSQPPLAVSNGNRVARLNADKVDGRDAAALANTIRRYRMPAGPTFYDSNARFRLPAVPVGYYQATLNTSVVANGNTLVQCVLVVGSRSYGGQLTPYTGGFFAIMSVSSLVRVASPTERIAVACAAQGAQVAFATPLVVTLERTEPAGTGAIQPVN